MIQTYETEIGQSVKATELYDYLGLTRGDYSRFIKRELLENPYADEKSYSALVQSEIRHGRFRQEYYLHIDFAKKLCMVSRSPKGNEIRDELVSLTKKVEDGDLLNHDQILAITRLKEIFKYVTRCKDAELIHFEKFASERPADKWVYADFHKMRNMLLDIGQDTINQRIKEYCIENSVNTTAKSKMDKMLVLDRYEVLRNGIWDYLMATNGQQPMKLANLAMNMAKIEGMPMYRTNETDLFRNKEIEVDIRSPKLLSPTTIPGDRGQSE